MTAQIQAARPVADLKITWEPLPKHFVLEDDPVDNEAQPLLAAALNESLELSGFVQPQMLFATNFGVCATVNGQIVVKAPDWLYVASVDQVGIENRRSHTPHVEGEVPAIVMEFLSETPGEEYSIKFTYPPGKWFFYEQILKVPIYVIFEPDSGLLEFYRLQNGAYQLEQPDPDGRHWVDPMKLFLGTCRGSRLNRTGYWLRWWTPEGEMLPWGTEKVEQERQKAEQERQKAEQERQKAERLAAYLRSQGIDPDHLPEG